MNQILYFHWLTCDNFETKQISTKSDVWSLGCILYLLLYKKTPFAHIKHVYAKMQAILDPNKRIEYAKLPSFYPPMLLEVRTMCRYYTYQSLLFIRVDQRPPTLVIQSHYLQFFTKVDYGPSIIFS